MDRLWACPTWTHKAALLSPQAASLWVSQALLALHRAAVMSRWSPLSHVGLNSNDLLKNLPVTLAFINKDGFIVVSILGRTF